MPGKPLFHTLLFFTAFFFTGCSFLLPSVKETTQSPWKSFAEAKAAYDKVVPFKSTVHEFKNLGINLSSSPNVRILSHLDIAATVQPIGHENLDEGLKLCLKANDDCMAYEFSPKSIKIKRYGNFWLDFLNFQRKAKETGWRFKALFVVVDNLVVYKVWSGDPNVEEYRQTTNPLGPLQDSGGMFMKFIY